MTVSQATARQPSLITPLNNLLSVLDLTAEIINFVIMSGQGCPEGQKMFVRIPNVPNVAHNLPIGSRLSPFWELRKPWGLDPR